MPLQHERKVRGVHGNWYRISPLLHKETFAPLQQQKPSQRGRWRRQEVFSCRGSIVTYPLGQCVVGESGSPDRHALNSHGGEVGRKRQQQAGTLTEILAHPLQILQFSSRLRDQHSAAEVFEYASGGVDECSSARNAPQDVGRVFFPVPGSYFKVND